MQKILEQYLLYKHTNEIEPSHISDEEYSIIKNLIPNNESTEVITNKVYYYKIRQFLYLIEKYIKDRQMILSFTNRLKTYQEIGVNLNDKNFVESAKEYKLKLFYDKFQTKEELEKELKTIFKN